MKQTALRILLIIVIITINIGCDQSTKYLAKKHLPRASTIQIVDNYVVLHYTENEGGFLSMFSTLPPMVRLIILSILPLITLLAMTVYVMARRDLPLSHGAALCCIIGGGLSNIADRLSGGGVVDFMNIGIGRVRSGIFNAADLSIMAGTLMIMLLIIREKKQHGAEA